MGHGDGTTRRAPRRAGRPPNRHAEPVGAPAWVAATVGLALTAAVGAASVTAVLVEGPAPPRPAPAPAPVPASTDPGPALLRLWGLRAAGTATPGPGASDRTVLAPLGPTDPVPRTALEQLYADLLPPPAG